jgi:hypothetical protein
MIPVGCSDMTRLDKDADRLPTEKGVLERSRTVELVGHGCGILMRLNDPEPFGSEEGI